MPKRSAPKWLPVKKFIAAAFLRPSTRSPRSENIYVTFDVDSMDPTLAPAREPTSRAASTFAEIDETDEANPHQGGSSSDWNIVEVNPYRDPSGRTAQTAIR